MTVNFKHVHLHNTSHFNYFVNIHLFFHFLDNTNSSPSNSIKPKSYLSTFLGSYRSPTQKSLASTNRKNPLFYSVSKPSVSLGENTTLTNEKDLIGRKEDEKFNEFKKNLLEELKVLKEANNLMRERNRLGIKPQKQPENRWLREFLEKRSGRSGNPITPNEMDVTTVRSKDFLRQELAGNNRKMVNNYLEKTKYDAGLRNIYSSSNNQKFRNGQPTSPEKLKPYGPDEWKLDAISSKLDFNIKGLLRDLGNFVKTSRQDEFFKVNIKEYMGKNCRVEFSGVDNEPQSQASQLETTQLQSPPTNKKKIQPKSNNMELPKQEEEKLEPEPLFMTPQQNKVDLTPKIQEENKADSLLPTQIKHIQDDVLQNLNDPEETKAEFIASLPQNDPEYPTQKAVVSCLSSLYDQAIHKVKHIKKKHRKTENANININSNDNENNNDEPEHDVPDQEINQQLISSSLNALYNTAIAQQQKKKSVKSHHQVEKKVAENYLEGLYENAVRHKKTHCLDLGDVKFKDVDKYDSFDRVIVGSLETLRENAVWLYFKTRVLCSEA